MKRSNGFTLLEMLIVIGIIAILGGVMLAQFSGSSESALAASCLNNMRTLCNAAIADGTKEGDYPSAGSFKYLDPESLDNKWSQGWIGYVGDSKSCTRVSCYHEASDKGMDQYFSITNGTLWRRMGGKISSYVCPLHMNMAKRGSKSSNGLVPSWSYVMNSYFGWERSVAANYDTAKRRFGAGYLTFMYSGRDDESAERPPERVLLFAELPFVDMASGPQRVTWSTSSSEENDSVLQYKPEGDEEAKANNAGTSGETIGFNHKSGRMYSAHIAFADGHCEKLMLPPGADEGNLLNLTTWLCTGQEYSFNGVRYEKVSD